MMIDGMAMMAKVAEACGVPKSYLIDPIPEAATTTFLAALMGRDPTEQEIAAFKTIREPQWKRINYKPKTPRGRKKFWNKLTKQIRRISGQLQRRLCSAIPNAPGDILGVYKMWRTQQATDIFTRQRLRETSVLERIIFDATVI